MSKSFTKKSRPILRSPGVPRTASTPQSKVRFQLPSFQLNEVFSSFTKRENTRPYEELVLALRDSELQDADLKQLLQCVRQCIPVLDESLHHFVSAFLNIKWVHCSDGVVEAYQDCLVELVSAHNYYIVSVLEALVSCFSQVFSSDEWEDGRPTQKEVDCYGKVHRVLQVLLKVVPMCGDKLVQAVVKKFPYLKIGAHVQECFLYNVLLIVEHNPTLAKDLMVLVVSRLVALDVSMPSLGPEEEEDVFEMEESGLLHTLDVLMGSLFRYIREKCAVDWEGAKNVYGLMLHVFERVVLPTHATGYVQFLMFYLCSFRLTMAEAFINFLWRAATAVSSPPVIRQAAVMYLGSFLARANYVTLNMLKSTLAEMATWIHKYICNQDEVENVCVDVRLHGVFYSVCQAVFYVVAFRHTDLVDSRRNLTFLQSLGLAQMVTSILNPLRACHPVVVRKFAAVTRTHQLAYCYTVMERNARSTMPVIYTDEMGLAVAATTSYMEAVFPFDPLRTPRCKSVVAPFYREFGYADVDEDNVDDADVDSDHSKEEDDDFLEDGLMGTSATDMLSVSMQ